MSENSERNDPWAPPESRPAQLPGIDLGKAASPASGPHDQPTVTSMPTDGFGPPQGDRLPPPPVAPGGPAQPAPGPYGYPAPGAAPAPGAQGGYGYPAPAGYPGSYGTYGGAGAWGPGPANGLGIASMVIGIVSLVTCFLYGLGVVLGILALVFGIIGRKRVQRGEANNGGMATAGIVTGAVGIVLGAVVLGLMIWAIVQGVNHEDDGGNHDDPYATSLVVTDPGTPAPR
ncbi:DUF4190 domain-containing protein [Streptomyces sp. TRM76323]|uniref:DUF4190 domain-containing protein n=1 Tax=Streptomyces tamarix TaxID=3078565 RepID=A0ABU3QM37_9ACTN|nr:DUF4190 domain-containing protein [Streptomyces tamarix]MDT9683821.1 DUF4190 domain-containing protein [Streptomyces tamarix]